MSGTLRPCQSFSSTSPMLRLMRKHYRKGISISNAEMKALTVVRDDELPAWNHTIALG